MAADFTIKQHDQLPELEVTLQDSVATIVDLSDAASVRFVMNVKGGENVIDAEATVVDAETGRVKYSWDFGDTETAGKYTGEFEVKFADDRVETFPNARHIQITIFADLGGVGI